MNTMSEFERLQTVADLRAARAELVTRGHGTGRMLNDVTGSVCMVGAIGVVAVPGFEQMSTMARHSACYTNERVVRARGQLMAHIPFPSGGPYEHVVSKVDYLWNDAATHADVDDVYAKAIADLGGAL